jgi:hypothetical protein
MEWYSSLYIYTWTYNCTWGFCVVKLSVDVKWIMYIGYVKEIKEADKTAQKNCIIHKINTKLTDKIKLRTRNFSCMPDYSSC